MAPQPNLIWKKNDLKAQKNGPHSNIYWVKVPASTHRNNLSIKTDQSKPTSGVARTSTLATGRTIRRKGSESSTTPTEISTRAAGTKIKDMVKAPTGSQTPKTSLGGSTLVIGKTTPSRAEALCSTKLEIDMTACGWITYPMVRDE